ALPGLERDAATGLHLSGRAQLRVLEPRRDLWCPPARRLLPGLSVESVGDPPEAGQRARGPLAGGHARVADPVAAAGVQLRRGAAGQQLDAGMGSPKGPRRPAPRADARERGGDPPAAAVVLARG